jgi:hypothetical protein
MKICFTACFGDQEKEVELALPSGGGGSCHIMIDRFYYGQMVRYQGKWIVYLNRKAAEELYTADRMILSEILENHMRFGEI